ncbi:MAG: hypothetical protein Q7W30_00755 [Coriobacteriia bacterium]|nr:hypothetical protein [Coriobacteriia bacterium]
MTTPSQRVSRLTIIGFVCALMLAAGLVFAGCTAPAASQGPTFPPPPPASPDLTTPEKAVDSYLAWVTFAYRMLNSDASSSTMEPTESVRVDSYIELNRQQGKGIDQKLLKFEVKSSKTTGSEAVIVAHEEWEYSYFSVSEPTKSVSPVYKVEYDVTYTLRRGKDMLWRVDHLYAKPFGEVK